MIREARGFGETINEAKDNAIESLGAKPDDDIQFEVISTPKKKTLGLFGGCKAEVRVFVEEPDPKPKKVAKKATEAKPQKPIKSAKTVSEDKPTDKKTEAKPAPKKVPAKAPTSVEDDFKDAIDESLIPADSQTGKAIAYLKTILAALGCKNLTVKAAVKENGAFILLDGEGLGAVIGHRGETLDALQYLTSLSANNGGGYFKISLNIGNYREKREQTLISLASRISEQVLSSGRSRRLEPMNPYERRIIHTAVQTIDGVSSNSIGEGSDRRVVISPENGEVRPPRSDDRRPGGDRRNGGRRDDRRGGGRRDDRRPSSTVATTPSREPKKDSDIPLYGKIN